MNEWDYRKGGGAGSVIMFGPRGEGGRTERTNIDRVLWAAIQVNMLQNRNVIRE
jgi:hypothetical protein